MSNAAAPSKVVYVGSIPYDQTEEQLLEIFREVGNVINIRLVLDRDTGKSKGFAFVEYHDIETAASAVRNLNNHPIGNRSLRVDFSHETTLGPPPSGGLDKKVSSSSSGDNGTATTSSLLPELPKGRPLQAGQTAAEMISHTIGSYERERTLQIISDMKSIIKNNPDQAKELLDQCPHLSFALVQSMLTLGLLNGDQVGSLVPGGAEAAPEEPPTQNGANGSGGGEDNEDEQTALLRQVMDLTEDQIANIPEEQRGQIIALRQQIMSGEISI